MQTTLVALPTWARSWFRFFCLFFQAEDGIRDDLVTGVQTCALPILINSQLVRLGLPTVLLALFWVPADAQTFRVQCPTSTITHPDATQTSSEPAYAASTYTPTTGTASDYTKGKTGPVNGAIKCQQISGGDGYATMGDGTQTYLFSFGPLSGITDIALGKPGTEFPAVFNVPFPVSTSNFLVPGDPATTIGATSVPLTAG